MFCTCWKNETALDTDCKLISGLLAFKGLSQPIVNVFEKNNLPPVIPYMNSMQQKEFQLPVTANTTVCLCLHATGSCVPKLSD